MSKSEGESFSISDALLPLLDVALVLLGLFVVLFSMATLDPVTHAGTEAADSADAPVLRPAGEAPVAVLALLGEERWRWQGRTREEIEGVEALRRTLRRFRDEAHEGRGIVMLVDEAAWTPMHDESLLQTRRAVLETGLRLGRAD